MSEKNRIVLIKSHVHAKTRKTNHRPPPFSRRRRRRPCLNWRYVLLSPRLRWGMIRRRIWRRRINLWWCRFGHSRRGLEHLTPDDRDRPRTAEDRTAAVLREQFRLRTAGSVDPGQLAQVARWHSKYVNSVNSVAVLRAPLTSRILRRFFCRPDRDCARRAGMEDAQVARAIGSLTAAQSVPSPRPSPLSSPRA